ncbi:MAG: mycofactocin-coupled SDR family oxidoreductase [Nocardioides sp.]|uniref:mycofactocin-coupled SDR family oxidoreductase n=1 Tax=Nocardioides sp. TaxID=35761 RepID=UPI0039E3CE07
MTGRVEGKVALITGAARGQGRDQALALAREGADIIAVDIARSVEGLDEFYPGTSGDDLDETVRLVEAAGGRIAATRADVRDLDAMSAALDVGLDRFGKIDIVSATAGVLVFGVPAHELTGEQWDTVLDINAKGVWHTAKVAIPHLIAQGTGGSIILNSSTAAHRAEVGGLAYVASKHAVVGIMRTLAKELAPYSVRVNTVHPCAVATPMVQNDRIYQGYRPDLDAPTLEQTTADFVAENMLPVPWIEVEDVSNAVVFLASEEARYITGTELKIDAGYTIK